MIGLEDIQKATILMKKYKDDNNAIYRKIIEAEEWFKLRHWGYIQNKNDKDPKPTSAWLTNVIMNKHADAMDNIPSPVFLPREASDTATAEELSQVVPVILENNDFEEIYDRNWWVKLIGGTCAYGVFWDKRMENGLGDIRVSKINMLNLYWEPGITDIQDSANVFTVELVSNELLEKMYGDDFHSGKAVEPATYFVDENIDTSNKSLVVDWYYKKYDKDGSCSLHYCKFVNDYIIYSSENENGNKPYYDHNLYPFVIDELYPIEGCLAGFGYIDLDKDTQMYVDKLQQVILKNSIQAARRRFFVSNSCAIQEEDISDPTKEIIRCAGNVDEEKIREMTTIPLDDIYVSILNNKIDELKETAGNREWAQGGTANGVTAASAIAALQESGSKLSRDMIKSSYRCHNKIMYLIIELIRQFYDAPRSFRIVQPNGQDGFMTFSNKGMIPQENVEMGQIHTRLPIFDIKIKSQKANPFSQASMNEEAKEMFARGMFNPQIADQTVIALQMMEFEGKDKVLKMVSQNGTLLQTVEQMSAQLEQMAGIIEQLTGVGMDGQAQLAGKESLEQGRPKDQPDMETSVDQLGRAHRFAKRDRTESARAQSASIATVG